MAHETPEEVRAMVNILRQASKGRDADRKYSGNYLSWAAAMLDSLSTRLAQAERERDSAQARVDALMLEFCPDEMTEEQTVNWARHQQRVPPDQEASLNAAIAVGGEA